VSEHRDALTRIPWVLVVFAVALLVPLLGSRYYTSVATEIVIFAMFATSLNLLLGVTGLVPFGHAAYFGIGAYVCGIFMKGLGIPFVLSWILGGLGGALFALVFGFFCVRLTSIYFSMLTMAFAQIAWAICFKLNDVTGGEQGYPSVPVPDLDWMGALPVVGDLRIGDKFYLVVLVLVAICIASMRRLVGSPFGRILATIRDNAERAQFIGIDVRRYQLLVFTIAGAFAGLAGGLFGIHNRGVFPDFLYWPKSAEVLIMTILGGIHNFWGPSVGAASLLLLNSWIVSYTEYWPFSLGIILLVLLFAFPGGIVGALAEIPARWMPARREPARLDQSGAPPDATGTGRALTHVDALIRRVRGRPHA
jgi:branched-chain amino acid transport system permease protein